jgi:hypothetical protein
MKKSEKLPNHLWSAFRILAAALLCGWALYLPRPSHLTPPSAHRLAAASFLGERSATPDSDPPPVDPDSLRHRQQLIEQMGVFTWHADGYRGQGLKIAVLDSGFAGYRNLLGKALPRQVKVRSFRGDGNLEARDSQHGLLCAEVLHALAPDAELLFANWEPEQPEQFVAAVRWARREGARVLSCSVIMPTWSDYEGNGPIHEALRDLVGKGDGPGDILCFASAGNTALRHWTGAFHDAGNGWHDWTSARSTGRAVTANTIRPWGGDRVSVELCCPKGSTYELVVSDQTAAVEVGRSVSADRDGLRYAVVAFAPQTGHAYTTQVRRLRDDSRPFHLVVLGGSLRYATRRGSIPFPGDGGEVIAVGAVDGSGHRLSYSSCGPKETGTKPDLGPRPLPQRLAAAALHGDIGGRAPGRRIGCPGVVPASRLDRRAGSHCPANRRPSRRDRQPGLGNRPRPLASPLMPPRQE